MVLQLLAIALVGILLFAVLVGPALLIQRKSQLEHRRDQASAEARRWRYRGHDADDHRYTIEGSALDGTRWTLQHQRPYKSTRGLTIWRAETPAPPWEFLVLPRSAAEELRRIQPTLDPQKLSHEIHHWLAVLIGFHVTELLPVASIWLRSRPLAAGSDRWQAAFTLSATHDQAASLLTWEVERAIERSASRMGHGNLVVVGSQTEVAIVTSTELTPGPDLEPLIGAGLALVRARN